MTEPNDNKANHSIDVAALSNIQPLRDLARNWDIDIASFLEDYLEEIVGHLEDNDDDDEHHHDEGSPNFAQAALLLHNSSHVYSRKVEYLYSLVYAALDNLAGNLKHGRRSSTSDADIEKLQAFDPDMQFLLLDDVVPADHTEVGDKVNVQDNGDMDGLPSTRLSSSAFPATRLSLGSMSVTRAGDRSSTAADGGRRSSAMGTLHEGSLKLQQGGVDDRGALLMPGTTNGGSQTTQPLFDDDDVVVNNLSPAPPAANNNDDDGDMMMYDNDDHDEGVGFDLANDQEPTGDFPGTTTNQPPPAETKQKADPWALLDPHDSGTTKARPLRIGVTYRLPEGLDEPPSKAVTGAHTRRRTLPTRQQMNNRAAPTVVMSIATETFKATVANRRAAALASMDEKDDDDTMLNHSSIFHQVVPRPRVPLKGLAFGDEFAYIAKATAKRKAAERRERRRLLAQNLQAAPEEEVDNLFGFDDFDAGDDHDHDDDDYGGQHFDEGGGNTGMASLDDAYASPDARDTSNMEAVEFEALCRAHMKAFAKGAQKYASETNLTKRVGDWQSRLAPILEEEERRPEFNIHDYGDRVIDILSDEIENTHGSKRTEKTNSVSFQQVTRDCEQYEVCRLFLASLNLTSAGNVGLSAGADPDSLSVRLLDTHVERPMENYMAPSATA